MKAQVGPAQAGPAGAERVRRWVAALVGNPNTGKTTLFNALSGLNQRVGNYPGVTVETKKGSMTCAGRPFDLIDLPGTYSLAPRSPDEMVAVDVVLGHQAGEPRPDVVVSIVDATNIDRNLYLTTQAMELGVPVVVALNMIDLAEAQGIRIDCEALSRRLGVPVVPIQANRKVGLDRLREAIAAAAEAGKAPDGPAFPEPFEREVRNLHEAVGAAEPIFLVRRLLLDVGGYTEQCLATRLGAGLRDQVSLARGRLTEAGCPVPAVEARSRYGWIREVTTGCIHRPSERRTTWTDRIDHLLTHRIWGTLVFLVLMVLVFQSIFIWAAPLMDLLKAGKDRLADLLRDALPAGPATSLLIEGIIEGVGAVVVFLPQILILFGFIAVLEDCGYMARAAFLMDRVMARCGLSGKSFIPLLSSVACAVPGIMATRVIEDRRDRLTTILVAPLMSCSARLPLYILLVSAFFTVGYPIWMPGVVMFCLYAIGFVTAPLVALALKRTLLRGQTPVFVMEMPSYRWPTVWGVLRRMFDSGWAFVRRAGTLILASMVLVWALLYFPTGHPEGGTYPERIAELETPEVKETREEYEKRGEELKVVRDRIRTQTRLESGWWGLFRWYFDPNALHSARAREEELIQEMKPFREILDPADDKINALTAEWKKKTYLGQVGQAIEPAVRPLGWNWKVGVAALASFPAREVVVGTLGICYQVGKVDPDEIRAAENAGETELGKAVRADLSTAGALALLVFFALCCQCASTLAVIRRETKTWTWPIFTFTYMTVLAYVAALVVYQIGSRLG
jgi:ferrous iron transport protein B